MARMELIQAVNAAGSRGLIVAPQPAPKRNVTPMKPRIFALLDRAYRRPCFVCGHRGDCEHREPRVELALMGLG